MQQNNNLNCDNYIVFIVVNSVSGNNQIGFDLPVDNLKTGKVRNTFPTTYGELNIHTLHKGGRAGNIFLLEGRFVPIPSIIISIKNLI